VYHVVSGQMFFRQVMKSAHSSNRKSEMKSAYEIAMERLGGLRTYSPEQKTRLAEIDRMYDAKRAEIILHLEERLKALSDDPEAETKAQALRQDAAMELARIEEKRESDKNRIRNQEQKTGS